MTRTTFDIVDILWEKINGSSLKDEISGGVHKHRRPVGSKLEDIVINTLPITGNQLQRALANVNLFVPNISIGVLEGQDSSMPNHTRLKELAIMAMDLLKENWEKDLTYEVQQQVLIKDDESDFHYINLRINFYSINHSN